MNLYCTIIEAIDPTSGEITKYGGPHVPGISFTDANRYCQENGLGYCQVESIFIFGCPADISFEDAQKLAWDAYIIQQN